MAEALEIVIPHSPVPKARPRVTRYGTYTPARTLKAEQEIGWLLLQKYPGLVPDRTSRFRLTLVFATSNQRADADNMQKLVMDAMNGVVYGDDSQVDRVEVVMKRLAPSARQLAHTRIRVELMEGPC